MSRRAQVLEGPHQWVQGFEHLARRLEWEEGDRTDWRAATRGQEGEADAPWPLWDRDHALAIAQAVGRLDRDTHPPSEPTPWDAFVDWATDLRARYLPDDPAWPNAECAAQADLGAALESEKGT